MKSYFSRVAVLNTNAKRVGLRTVFVLSFFVAKLHS